MGRYGITFSVTQDYYIEIDAVDPTEVEQRIYDKDINLSDAIPMCSYMDVIEVNSMEDEEV